MSKSGSPLRKVTLEYEDRIQTLEGEEADNWMDAINDRIIFCHHRPAIAKFPKFEWHVTNKEILERPKE